MKFKYLIFLVLFYCANSIAAPDFSLGWGTIFGAGPGVMLSTQSDNYKYFGSLGLAGYSQSTGSELGYGVGVDYNFIDTKSSVGIFLGSVAVHVSSINSYSEVATYNGLAVSYNYHFSGFNRRGWLVGLAAYSGKTNDSGILNDSSTSGTNFNVGFQL